MKFQWESPTYTISLSLLIICAAASAAIGALLNVQTKYHGMALLGLFVVVGFIQYFNNIDLEMYDDDVKHYPSSS